MSSVLEDTDTLDCEDWDCEHVTIDPEDTDTLHFVDCEDLTTDTEDSPTTAVAETVKASGSRATAATNADVVTAATMKREFVIISLSDIMYWS
ncbi:hypothetical protein Ngar_c18250 [Candidatus Nitrososphaera gargensis Ga9.2]|uniref:Uncharacterized protein n=1 Tax=Nitrososphaera gargensis (strain Ga9.2) TaxID=1237085 RepID=K0IID9_NITGG|nr:hypothetical protein [Candidatus Nitrososphaera gargensis]AFU58758.1 hypothetical protein Ngar_c18250 [Candidatus Nitrososphaera gargensis Ga9.2]